MSKNNIKILLLTFALISISVAGAFAASTTDPSRSYFGARPLGLGGAFTAVSDDGNAFFTNPAGLSLLTCPQFVATSRPLFFEETLYSAASFAWPTGWGTFGMAFVDASCGGSYPTIRDPATDRITIDLSREATEYDNNVLFVSYSKTLWESLALGFNYKIYNQSISGGENLRGTAANADAGFIYKPHFLRWLRLGCNYQNLLGGAIKWNTAAGTEDALGSTIKTGIAINLFGSSPEAIFNTGSHKVVLSIDYDLIGSSTLSEQTSDVKLGLEYSPMKSLALRLGCDSNLGIALGVGFEQSGFRFDYTYLQNSTVAGNNPHYFSIVYSALPAPGPAEQTLDTTAPQINVYSPKDKSLTNEPLIPVTGWVGKVHKKGTITTTTETYVTTLPDENGKSRVVTRRVTREIFKPTLIETSTLEQLADLRLNTKPVRHNRYGTFEASINLELGRNLLTFEALTLRQDIISTKTIRLLRYFPFSDMPTNHWAIEPIAFISTFGIINGYPDKTYKPTAPITRAELVTLLMKARNYSLPQIDTAPFKDVATTHWAAPYILMASQESLVLGYPDKTFKPKNNLTRAEGVTILARFAAIEMGRTTELTPFPDLAENHWAIEYVRKAKAAGMLNYLEKQNFDPNTLFSREEAAEILFRTPQLQQLVDAFWETGITSLDQIMPATPSSIIPLTPLSPEIIPTVPAITPPALSAPEAAPINSSTAEATPTRLSTGEVSPASSSTTETTSQ